MDLLARDQTTTYVPPNDVIKTSTPEMKVNYTIFCLYSVGSANEKLALQIMTCYANPALAIVGFGANMLCIEILRRSGLRKPSNIFLLSLVVADSMSQLQSMNFGEVLMFWGPDQKHSELCGWQYGETVDFFLFVSTVVIYVLGGLGGCVNTFVPVLITAERMIAVFFPITFKKIVTTKTAVIAAFIAYAVWIPWVLTFSTLYQFYRIPIYNKDYYSFVALGMKYFKNRPLYDLLNHYVFQVFSSWVPVAIVSVGCTFIGVKVFYTLRLRKRMTSKNISIHWSPRTTRTLLLTCLVFTVTNLSISFLNFYILSGFKQNIWFLIGSEITYFITLIGSSSNFFVYITSNRKLMKIFLDIVHFRKHTSAVF
ncbi:thyrotropin-releasing hormone receptor-like [Biomphalaria glabrata]|uniref:Thyrotropin-releasing hormone receptor-like n=1 Tax=Biomphalaria glabrata TaxID=6526 RepID=A0A9W2Z3H3_BIOGL|nr:thyrotropin-releasing hormone receptor-like [Biomphalaria glabrata]